MEPQWPKETWRRRLPNHRACRYQRLIHEATDLSFEEGPREGVLRHALPGGLAVAQGPAEFLVTAWVRFGRLVTGRDWLPTRVCFAHQAPVDISEHHRVFGDGVLFSTGRTAMHVPNEILDVENARADEDPARMMKNCSVLSVAEKHGDIYSAIFIPLFEVDRIRFVK